MAVDIVTQKQLNLLIHLAKADKVFARAEKKMIEQIAQNKGFPRQQLKHLFRQSEPIGSLGALSPAQKFEYLYDAVCLMLVDGKIAKQELLFCYGIAVNMGLRKQVIDKLQQVLTATMPKTKDEIWSSLRHLFT